MSTLWDSIKKGLSDGAKIAEEGVYIAAEKAKELGKKSKVHIEIGNIKRKIEKQFSELGGKAYHLIQEEKVKDITKKDDIKELLDAITSLENELKEKQEELEKITIAYHNVEEGDSDSESSSKDKSE